MTDRLAMFLRHPNPLDFTRWDQTWLAYRIDCLIGGHVWSDAGVCHDCGKRKRSTR